MRLYLEPHKIGDDRVWGCLGGGSWWNMGSSDVHVCVCVCARACVCTHGHLNECLKMWYDPVANNLCVCK